MKWTKPSIRAPAAAQFYPRFRSEVNKIDTGFYFVNGGHVFGRRTKDRRRRAKDGRPRANDEMNQVISSVLRPLSSVNGLEL
jgi:hypothetical protein